MLNNAKSTLLALAAYLVPCLPVQLLTLFAAVLADPTILHVSTGHAYLVKEFAW
jgi:hypothetical protein